MKSYKSLLLIIFFAAFLFDTSVAQSYTVSNVCLSADELKLASQINNLRKQHKLPEIPLSKSLSVVAKTHVWDLQTNKPDTAYCTAASWSNMGKWKACCFNPRAPNYDCIWNKPKELTAYPFRGYELVYYDEENIDADIILSILESSYYTIDMLLTRNAHKDKEWRAMGLAISENYVSFWFGQRQDAAGVPPICATPSQAELLTIQKEEAKKPEIKESFKEEIHSAEEVKIQEIPQTTDERLDIKSTQTEVTASKVQESAEKEVTAIAEEAGTFHLIYGSFSKRADANEALRRYKNSGLPKAGILEKDGRFRVSLDRFDNQQDAINARNKLKASYPEIWIYKE